MKEVNKNIISLFILILLLSIDSTLFYLKIFNGEIFTAIFASVVTAYYAYLKLKIENDKMFKDLFESFNNKYNGDTNDIFNELRKISPETKIEEVKENGENIILDYFNLCAEEYLWYSKGRIPEKVWKAWKCGIIENINIPQVKELYKKEIKNGTDSFYGLVEELNIT
jgi:hypothetical protein